MTIRKLTVKELFAFAVTIQEEYEQPCDLECHEGFEQAVQDMVDKHGTWGWCIVTVTARWEGFVGTSHLGGCSYKSLSDFEKSGYYSSLLQDATDDLNKNIKRAYDTVKKLEVNDV